MRLLHCSLAIVALLTCVAIVIYEVRWIGRSDLAWVIIGVAGAVVLLSSAFIGHLLQEDRLHGDQAVR